MGQVADAIARSTQIGLAGAAQVTGQITAASESEVRNATLLEQQRRAEEERLLRLQALGQAAKAQEDTSTYQKGHLALQEKQLSRQEDAATETGRHNLAMEKIQQGALENEKYKIDKVYEAKTLDFTKKLAEKTGGDIIAQGTSLYGTYSAFMTARSAAKDEAVGGVVTARIPQEEYDKSLKAFHTSLVATVGAGNADQKLKDELGTVTHLQNSIQATIENKKLQSYPLERLNSVFEEVKAKLSPGSPNVAFVNTMQVDTINQWKHMGGDSPALRKIPFVGGFGAAQEKGAEVAKLNKGAFSSGNPNPDIFKGKTNKVVQANAAGN